MIYYFLATFIGLVGGFGMIYQLLTKQLMVIHDLVNSNLTKVKADLETALTRIQILEEILSSKTG